MIDVPVQRAGQLPWAHLVKLKPQWTARKPQPLRVAHELPEISALERNRETLTQLGEVNTQAVRTRQHRKGQAAFGGFGLQDGASHEAFIWCTCLLVIQRANPAIVEQWLFSVYRTSAGDN